MAHPGPGLRPCLWTAPCGPPPSPRGHNLPTVEGLDSTAGWVAVGAGAVALLSLLLCVVLMVRVRRLRADQKLVLGDGKQDLVAHAAGLARVIDYMNDTLEAETERTAARLAAVEDRLD